MIPTQGLTAQNAGPLLQDGMLKFIEGFIRGVRDQARWRRLLWDVVQSEWPEHDGYPDVAWPAWRLYRHAAGHVGQNPQIQQRARDFPSRQSFDTAITRYRAAFQRFVPQSVPKDTWDAIGNFIRINLRGVVMSAVSAGLDLFEPFRQLLKPADDWTSRICDELEIRLKRGNGPVVAVAHYPADYAGFLPAVALDVKGELTARIPNLGANVVPPDVEELENHIEDLKPARDSLLIVPVAGAAAFLDLEDGLWEAAAGRCHLLVFCPDAATAERIEEVQMSGYSSFDIYLSPWCQPEPPMPGHPLVPAWAEQVTQHSRLLQVLAAFSALHRRPTLDSLAAITGLDEAAIEDYITNWTDGQVQFNPATRRAYWSSEDGSEAFLERFFDTPERLRDLYVGIIQTLHSARPAGWARAALNLLKSMYQTARLRLLRAVLLALEERGVLPGDLLAGFHADAQFQARLDLARVYAHAYLYKKAHDLLLEADVPENDPGRFDDFWNHQLLVAEILTRQVADTGKTCFFEAAKFVYEDLRERVFGDNSRNQQLDERLAELDLEAGRAQNALDRLNLYGGNPSLFGNSLKARALAELGRFDEAVPSVGRPRGFQLDRLPGEDQNAYEGRWSEHVQELLGKPAREVPVEALHQAAVRALERGHFATAQKLLEHARTHYRDNVYLSVAWARLLLETGRAEEAVDHLWEVEKNLTGQDNEVVEGALYDALIELWSVQGAGMKRAWQDRLRRIPDPIFGAGFRREHYLAPQRARLITLNAKAWWRGALGDRQPGQANLVIAELDALRTPPALNLAALILAGNGDYGDAITKFQASLALASDPQTRIRTLNTGAQILLRLAAAGDDRAGQLLKASEQLDAGNSYTMLLRAEWLEGCGKAKEAAELRRRADELRRTTQ